MFFHSYKLQELLGVSGDLEFHLFFTNLHHETYEKGSFSTSDYKNLTQLFLLICIN